VSQKELAIGCCESESASISHDSVAMCLRYGEIFNRTLHLPDFFCMLRMAVARSFSCGDVILCVLPVLWMTSYLHNAHKPRQLNVATQLMEAQPTCSLGRGKNGM